MTESRVLVVVFDALRPEFVTPELMPNFCRFAAGGTRFEPRSTFPTETRVNQTTVLTGCTPARHGIVANKFVAGDLDPGRLLDTGKDEVLRRAMERGEVVQARHLADRVAAGGKRYASLSAGTAGGGLLLGLTAERTGALRHAMRAPERCHPEDLHAALVDRIGPLPDHVPPAHAWIDWAVAAYLDHIEPVHRPNAMVLWLSEPDESFHHLGVGSPDARAIIAHVDRAFGRILDRHAEALASGALHVIAMSDHGQLTLEGAPLDLPARLREAGFAASETSLEDAECLVAVESAGGIWVREPALVHRLVRWLQSQDWCGPLFTRAGLPGTLAMTEGLIEHARAPDIALILAAHDGTNGYGLAGLSRHDSAYPGGCHGGLSTAETNNVLVIGGARVPAGKQSRAAVGNIDIAPTIADLLGLDGEDMEGRNLLSAIDEVAQTATIRSDPAHGFTTCLTYRTDGTRRYLDSAWVER